MPGRRSLTPEGQQAWLFDVLAGATAAAAWAPAGRLPPGLQRTDTFAVLPAGGDRSFVVSLASRRGAASALTSYNALRPLRRRIARRALGIGLRAGLAQRAVETRIDVGAAAGTAPDQLADALLTEYVRGLFGADRIAIAVGSGGGPYRKPVLQVFAADGAALGYVKVGWNDWTNDAVRRETAALQACAARPMGIGVPALLHRSAWHGMELLVTAPLPRGVRRLRNGADALDAGWLREISMLSSAWAGELAASPYWQGLLARILTGVSDAEARARLQGLADRVAGAHGRTALEFGTWHGDFVPWNLAHLRGRLYAWDWEGSAPDAPVGFDALHFHFQVAFLAQRRPLGEAAATAAREATGVLSALGVPRQDHRVLATLHLLELLVRHEEARSSSGATDRRFYPAMWHVLSESLGMPRDDTSPHHLKLAS